MRPEQMLEEVKRRLSLTYRNYSFKPNEWFFPSDVTPHSTSFKYKCKKLHALGILERQGDGSARWGYRYRVPNDEKEKQELARMVKRQIELGRSMTTTVKRLSGLGYKQHTIRAYYKVFSRE